MNLPNRLTVARLAITFVFVVVLSLEFPFHHTVAFILFTIATVTDYYDGEIARRNNLITDFGILMDPLVDKIMTAAAFIALIPRGVMPAWVVIIVISREFLITGLRLLSINKGVVLPSENLGKHKTSWQIGTVLYFLLFLSVQEFTGTLERVGVSWLMPTMQWIGYGGITVTVVLTLGSGLLYVWKHRSLIEDR